MMRYSQVAAAAVLGLMFFSAGFGAVSVTSGTDEGQSAWVVTTATATYYLHKEAGGLSSLVDKDGKDWISFNRTAGSKGMYRGIPNFIYPGDIYHPGYTWCSSSVISETSSKVVIEVTSSRNGSSRATYEFTDERCLLTMHSSTHNSGQYWFLYEGTPGDGTFVPSSDYWFTATQTAKTKCTTRQDGDLKESKAGTGEWICFGDPSYQRVIFLVHHEDDSNLDKFYEMNQDMTVFGFGRSGTSKYLSGKNTFSLGLFENDDYNTVKNFIEAGFSSAPIPVTLEEAQQDVKGHKAGSVSESAAQTTIDKYAKEEAK